MYDLIIKNGTLVTPTSSFRADVAVKDGKICAVAQSISGAGAGVVDASGKLVLPGAIDPHTHLAMPFGGTISADDYYAGTRAAVWRRHHHRVRLCPSGLWGEHGGHYQAPGRPVRAGRLLRLRLPHRRQGRQRRPAGLHGRGGGVRRLLLQGIHGLRLRRLRRRVLARC